MQLWRDTGAALARATGMLAARSQEPPRSGKAGPVTARPQFYAPYIVVPSPTVWPSGLRRWLQAPVRKGVGSNPTAVTCQLNLSAAAASAPRARTCCRCRPAFLHWRALPSRPTGRFGKRGALERAEPCRRHAMFRAHFGVEMFSKNRAHWKSCRDLVSACGRPLV